MRSALHDAANTKFCATATASTLQALVTRGVCHPGGLLTEKGRVAALALAALPSQCAHLRIPLVEVPSSACNKPELAAKSILESEGYEVCFTEGGIVLVILYCLAFTRLRALGEERWGGLHYEKVLFGKRQTPVQSWMYAGLMCYKELLAACANLEDLMVADVAGISRTEMLANFDILQSWQVNATWFPYGYIGLTRSLIGKTYDALGPQALSAIARQIFTDPYAYVKGWPDLTAARGRELLFVEVKAGDRLIPSQLITIPDMMRAAQLPVVVWHLSGRGASKLP